MVRALAPTSPLVRCPSVARWLNSRVSAPLERSSTNVTILPSGVESIEVSVEALSGVVFVAGLDAMATLPLVSCPVKAAVVLSVGRRDSIGHRSELLGPVGPITLA